MTAAPTQSLVERVARAICQAMPLAWVDTCRPSAPIPDGCLLPLDEETCDGRVLARAALAACRAEELVATLRDLLGDTQHRGHDCGDSPENCPVIHARSLLAEQDGTAPGGAAQPMPPATDQPVDCREAFEKWYLAALGSPILAHETTLQRCGDGYMLPTPYAAWRGWQEAWDRRVPVRESSHLKYLEDWHYVTQSLIGTVELYLSTGDYEKAKQRMAHYKAMLPQFKVDEQGGQP